MGKVLLGIIVGSSATSALFLLLNRQTAEPAAEAAAVSVQPGGVERNERNTFRISMEADQSVPINSLSSGEPSLPTENDRPTDEQLKRDMEAALGVYVRTAAELVKRERAQVMEDPIVYPIPLPSEFDWLSDSLRFEHEALQREHRDEAWAARAEEQLLSYFYDRPAVLQYFGAPTINCGSTRCAVTFLRFDTSDDAPSVYRTVILDLQNQPGLAPDVNSSVWSENSEGDITTVYWSFERSPPIGPLTRDVGP